MRNTNNWLKDSLILKKERKYEVSNIEMLWKVSLRLYSMEESIIMLVNNPLAIVLVSVG